MYETSTGFPLVTSLQTNVAIHDLAADGAEILSGTFTPAGPTVMIDVQAAYTFLGCSRAALLLYVGQPDVAGGRLYDSGGKPLPDVNVYSASSVNGESAWASTTYRRFVIDVDNGREVTWQLLAAIIGGGAVVEIDGPERIAITPDGTKAFVTSPSADNVTPIVLGRPGYSYDQKLHPMDVAGPPIAIEGSPTFVSADDDHVVVSNGAAGTISIISVESNSIVRHVPIPGGEPLGTAIAPDGTSAVVGTADGRVARVDLSSGDVKDVAAGQLIRDVEVLADGTSAYAVDGATGIAYRIGLEGMTVDARIDVGDGPSAVRVAPDGQVWVLCRPDSPAVSRLKRIDPATDRVAADYALPYPGARDLAIVPVAGQTSDLVRTAWCVFDGGRYAEMYIGGPFTGEVHSFHHGSLEEGTDAAGAIAINDYGEIWVVQPALDKIWKWLGGRLTCRADTTRPFMDLLWGEYCDVAVYGAVQH